MSCSIPGYISVAKNGLAEVELEDILSCDDMLMQDAFMYHNPPDDITIRVPQLYWQRLRHEIRGFLLYQNRDGKKLMQWVHPIIANVIKTRYMKDEDEVLDLHKTMVDYYLGKWSNTHKPIEELGKKKLLHEKAMRRPVYQPIIYPSGLFNLRKMSELPYHLVKSHQYGEFVNQICHKFEWLYHKTQARGIQSVLNDLTVALQNVGDAPPQIIEQNGQVIDEKGYDDEEEEIQHLYKILYLRHDFVRRDPSSLATQVIFIYKLYYLTKTDHTLL